MNKSKIEPLYKNYDWLKSTYTDTKSIYKVAQIICCSPRTIHEWLIKFNIPRIGRINYRHSDEIKSKIANASKGKKPMLGKSHSLETKRLMSKTRKGEGNANWKGGKTVKVRRFRRSKEYVAWRTTIIMRAKGKCQHCGEESPLEAHHKISLSKDFSLALDLDNGIALCHNCHNKADGRVSYEQAR